MWHVIRDINDIPIYMKLPNKYICKFSVILSANGIKWYININDNIPNTK